MHYIPSLFGRSNPLPDEPNPVPLETRKNQVDQRISNEALEKIEFIQVEVFNALDKLDEIKIAENIPLEKAQKLKKLKNSTKNFYQSILLFIE